MLATCKYIHFSEFEVLFWLVACAFENSLLFGCLANRESPSCCSSSVGEEDKVDNEKELCGKQVRKKHRLTDLVVLTSIQYFFSSVFQLLNCSYA